MAKKRTYTDAENAKRAQLHLRTVQHKNQAPKLRLLIGKDVILGLGLRPRDIVAVSFEKDDHCIVIENPRKRRRSTGEWWTLSVSSQHTCIAYITRATMLPRLPVGDTLQVTHRDTGILKARLPVSAFFEEPARIVTPDIDDFLSSSIEAPTKRPVPAYLSLPPFNRYYVPDAT